MASTQYQQRIETKIAMIRNQKVRDILRAGSRAGSQLREVYVDASIEAIADEMIRLQIAAGEGADPSPLPDGIPARFLKI